MSHCIVKAALESGKLHLDQREWAESLCSRDRESLEAYLRFPVTKPKPCCPTLVAGVCAVCQEDRAYCFQVVSTWRPHDHCTTEGHQTVCVLCMESGAWRAGWFNYKHKEK